MRRRSQAGVTLMELLIAITLLSLVSVGMLMALRIGLNTYSKAQSHLMDNRRVAGAQRILQDQLEGMIPVVTACGGSSRMPFFQGQPESMRLITRYSLQEAWRGQAQILELFLIPGAKGGVRLVVNEIPYYLPTQAARFCGGPQASASPTSFVLADRLAFCRFSYLDQPDDPNAKPVWRPQMEGRKWPLAVRIEMRPMEPDFSRLQPLTVTAPLSGDSL
jgi:general secretion pathway protein J